MSVLLVACLAVPVRVTNTPDLPVPTAPMAIIVPQEDGTELVNPQLGTPPQASDFERPSPGVWSILAGVLPSPWREILLGFLGLLGGRALNSKKARLAELLVCAIDNFRQKNSAQPLERELRAVMDARDKGLVRKLRKRKTRQDALSEHKTPEQNPYEA